MGPALYPLTFEPILKERVWGGRRLQQLYGKRLPDGILAGESWEITDRPGDVSVIANGPLAGKDLHWLLQTDAAGVLGSASLCNGRFPLLIKILDAAETLSLQVHPPAVKARQLGGEPKTEMWFIADAVPGAELYAGLRKGCTRQEFVQKVQQGTVAECFHRLPVRAGDAMFLPSGRVHALGAGLVLFEIQQNSDTTYRVFDWNRAGLDGKPRELHLEKSLQSIDFDDFEPSLVQPRPCPGPVQRFSLVQDSLFSVDLAVLKAGQSLTMTKGVMQVIAVVSGELRVSSGTDELSLSAGQFSLLPAALRSANIGARTEARCLCVRCGA